MSIENYTNDSQDGVVDHQEEIENNQENNIDYEENTVNINTDSEEQAEKPEEVAEPETVKDVNVEDNEQEQQTKEENTIYRNMRLKAEKEAQEKVKEELNRIEIEKAELKKLQVERQAIEVETRIKNELLTEDNISNLEINEGVSRDVAIRLLNSEAEKLISDERNKVTKRFTMIQNQKDKLRTDEFYNFIENDVDEIVKNNPNVDFETAYNYTVGQRYRELKDKVNKRNQSNTIANFQDRMRRKPVNSDNGGTALKKQPELSQTGIEMANAFGNDPKLVAKRLKK